MSDSEYAAILRRAIIMIVSASIKKFSLSWLDFLPRDVATVTPLANWTVTPDNGAIVERG